jgi:hypothetical protein
MSIAQAFIGINLAVNVILVFWVIKPQMGCLLSSVVLGFVLLFGGGLLMDGVPFLVGSCGGKVAALPCQSVFCEFGLT